ncbi:hypothetical protein FTW19_08970 [Terriglobus albidus]|uniref:Glycosyltransferase RgtA/B/C/D-like domain-containing protein n=1 Tax=Terriglobus albidus TaxID=1592106 RepID=A0A5B9ECC2_9BACT|nr:hypothetical protein [Terriglobus albidus]QEE28111.1 hypothetical protein FTW19_08970 [Terriglobus albidus]
MLLVSSCFLIVCVVFFAIATIHWPLAGDASLMHYIAFLMDNGRVPYRDIADMNLPGAYSIDYAVMHVLGGGSLAWRSFDLGLTLAGALAMICISRPCGWYPGIFSGALLALIHGQDGIFEPGQRDFVIAVLLLIAYAAFFQAFRKNFPPWMFLFGLCVSMTGTIKPVFLPFGAVLLGCATIMRRTKCQPVSWFILWGAGGLFVPIVAMYSFLRVMHCTEEFFTVVRGLMPYHASLARKPLGFLLVHSISPLLPLATVWGCCLFSQWRQWKNWEGVTLLIGLFFGLGSYVIQGKGYSYHRYPFIALFLLVMAIDFQRCLTGNRWTRRLGWAGIAFGTLFVAPVSTLKASQYDWRNVEFSTMLQSDLRRLGGEELSGQVQCIDTVGGCFDVLYEMRLLQRDRFVYDEFLFAPARDESVINSREEFLAEIYEKPPRVVVITDDLFPSGPAGFQKLERWPQFASYLQANYRLCAEGTPLSDLRWWSRKQPPHSYRIFCSLRP